MTRPGETGHGWEHTGGNYPRQGRLHRYPFIGAARSKARQGSVWTRPCKPLPPPRAEDGGQTSVGMLPPECAVGLTYPYTYLHAHCALSQTYSVDDSARACRLVEDVYASFVAVHVVDLFESAPSGGFENEMITNSDMSHVAITPVNEASQRGCVFTRPDVACKLKRRLYPLFHCYLHPLLHLFGHAGRAYPVRARSSVEMRCLMKQSAPPLQAFPAL